MPSWDAVVAAIGVALGGNRVRGRVELAACWQATSETAYGQRCALAHYLADFEGDDEVVWDERALAAYAGLGRGDLVTVAIPDAAGMAPSLDLDLGDGSCAGPSARRPAPSSTRVWPRRASWARTGTAR